MSNCHVQNLNKIIEDIRNEHNNYYIEIAAKMYLTFINVSNIDHKYVSKNDFYKIIYETPCLEGVNEFASRTAYNKRSSWSGGFSVSNMLEQIEREIALCYVNKSVYPIGMADKIYKEVEKLIDKENLNEV